MAKSRKSKGKDGSSILVIIAVLALLASIGVAIYKLSGQHGNGGGNKTCASFQGSCQSGTPKSPTTKCNTCAANECCDPPTCKNFKECGPKQRLISNTLCALSGCTKNDCCEKPTMCSEDKITCGIGRAVDTSLKCKADECRADECCTYEAWVENKAKEIINDVVTTFSDCDNKQAAFSAVKNVLKTKCKDQTGRSLVKCAIMNAVPATDAAEKACKPK